MTNLEHLEATISELLDDSQAWKITNDNCTLEHNSKICLWISGTVNNFELWNPRFVLPLEVADRLRNKALGVVENLNSVAGAEPGAKIALDAVNELLGIGAPETVAPVEAPADANPYGSVQFDPAEGEAPAIITDAEQVGYLPTDDGPF